MKTAVEVTLIGAAALACLGVNEVTEIFAHQQPQRNGWTIGRPRALGVVRRQSAGDRVRFGLDRSVDTSRTTWATDLPWSSFNGLTRQQLSRLSGTHTFEFVRDAGTFICTGKFSGGRGHGLYRFVPNQRYVSQLQELGFPLPSSEDIYSLAFSDVSLEFARMVGAAGLNASTRELLELRHHGINAAYLRDAQATGLGRWTAQDYVEMHNHGVQPEFLRHLKNAGYVELSTSEIVEMRNHGVDSGYIKDLARHGLKPAPRDLVEMKNQGVSPRFLNTLAQAGLGQLDPHEVVELRNQNVTPEFILEAKALGYRFSGREMINLRHQGVDGAYLRKLKASGFQDLTAEKIAKLRTHGID